MRRAWIALLVILIGVLSQPPTKCRGVVAQVVESQPTRGNYARAGYKGDANQAFPSVDTAQATNAQVKSDEEAQDRKTNTAINGQIRYFNGGLLIVAVFALGAAILQGSKSGVCLFGAVETRTHVYGWGRHPRVESNCVLQE
jgi:hypothetical protein